MVCLSLVCHYPGVRKLITQFRLGEKRVLWEKGTLLEESNRSDRFGGSRGTSLVFVLVMSLGLLQEVVVLVDGLGSLHVVSLLGVLPLVLNTRMGGVVALRRRGGTIHGLPFVVLVLLQLERVGSLIVVTMVVFVEVALIGEVLWSVLTPLWSK
jgi:hypothetical protein